MQKKIEDLNDCNCGKAIKVNDKKRNIKLPKRVIKKKL